MNGNYELIENELFEGERPLFHSSYIKLSNCRFTTGESAVKESNNIKVDDCELSSKYLFWHDEYVEIENSHFLEGGRASVWYTHNVSLKNSRVDSPKIFRDAKNIEIFNTSFKTDETLWDCENVKIKGASFKGDYLLLHSSNLEVEDFELDGNYSFQHTKNASFRNIKIKSKDAFWNSTDVTVYDSEINGEYLGWYSTNLKFVNCKISGTQPFCYANNLVLENCEMVNTDLAFEYSTIDAEVTTSIDSVKNPISGRLIAKEIKNLILNDKRVDTENLHLDANIVNKEK